MSLVGARILDKLEKDLADISEVEMRPRMEGNQMFIFFGPKRHKGGAKPDRPAAPRAAPPKAVVAEVAQPAAPKSDGGEGNPPPPPPAPVSEG